MWCSRSNFTRVGSIRPDSADLSRPPRRSSIGGVALAVGIAVIALGANVVWGERSQVGNLIVSLNANVSPHRVPRTRYVPATLRLQTRFRTTDGSLMPRLKGLTIDLSSRGKLFNKGLPSCSLRELEPSSPQRAIGLCGKSLVGRGRLHAIVGAAGTIALSAPGETACLQRQVGKRAEDCARPSVWVDTPNLVRSPLRHPPQQL